MGFDIGLISCVVVVFWFLALGVYGWYVGISLKASGRYLVQVLALDV